MGSRIINIAEVLKTPRKEKDYRQPVAFSDSMPVKNPNRRRPVFLSREKETSKITHTESVFTAVCILFALLIFGYGSFLLYKNHPYLFWGIITASVVSLLGVFVLILILKATEKQQKEDNISSKHPDFLENTSNT